MTVTQRQRKAAKDTEYARVHDLVLARPLGGACERGGTKRAVHVHHRRLRAQGGQHRASNCAALCDDCHEWLHRHPAAARLEGWILTEADDPELTPVTLPNGWRVLLDDDGTYALTAA